MIGLKQMRMGVVALGILGLTGAGAPTAHHEGVVEADRWMHDGDMARSGRLWAIAYESYRKVAETFPATPHGRLAARQARRMQAKMVRPDKSPNSDGDVTWFLTEIIDFVTWP